MQTGWRRLVEAVAARAAKLASCMKNPGRSQVPEQARKIPAPHDC
jgi:hypothetical protein